MAPKRCGHTKGKDVVDRATAVARVRAAVDASREAAAAFDDSILIVARTDARATHGLDEALERAHAFREAGADISFVEAPQVAGYLLASPSSAVSSPSASSPPHLLASSPPHLRALRR